MAVYNNKKRITARKFTWIHSKYKIQEHSNQIHASICEKFTRNFWV